MCRFSAAGNDDLAGFEDRNHILPKMTYRGQGDCDQVDIQAGMTHRDGTAWLG